MLAFVRDPNKPVHPLTIGKLVHSTMVTADVAGSLLGVMKGVFTPALQSKEQWPESIRKEFAGGIHRYMAQLTEQTHILSKVLTVVHGGSPVSLYCLMNSSPVQRDI